MAVERLGERTGAELIRGMNIGNNCEKDKRTGAEGSAGKSMLGTNV